MKAKKILILIIAVHLITTGFSYSAGHDIAGIKEVIIMLEKSIKPPFMSKDWNKKRIIWLNMLQQAGANFSVIKKVILQLDQNIRMDAYKTEHQSAVAEWHLYLSSADSVKLIYQALMEINSSLDINARQDNWSTEEIKWIARIKVNSNQ